VPQGEKAWHDNSIRLMASKLCAPLATKKHAALRRGSD
jgi:hypothetical protein